LPATAAALTCSLGGILAPLGTAGLAVAATDSATQASGPTAAEASAAATGTVAPTDPATSRARVHQDLAWDYCGQRPHKLGPAPAARPPGDDEPVKIEADAAEYDQGSEVVRLRGDVVIRRGDQAIEGQETTYDRRSLEAVAAGNAFLEHPGLRIAGPRAQFNLGTDQGGISDAYFRLTGPINARGQADQVSILSRDLAHLSGVTFTTCPPDSAAWGLRASSLAIDNTSGRGVARNATLRIRDVPVLFTPYFDFPIDDRRQTGLLIPSVGVSDTTGFDLSIPYYFNLAPNLDATLTPRIMGQRGLMLGGETRFLTERQRGTLRGEILPDDIKSDDNATRWAIHADQQGLFGQRWSTALNLDAVSDDRYLGDFGNTLAATSARNLERRGDLLYGGNGWSLLSRLQQFQTVDPTLAPSDRPYARLPQLLLTVTPWRSDWGPEAGADGEYDWFSHSDKVEGQRIAVAPWVSWPLRRPYGHLIPRAKLRTAAYALQDQAEGAPSDPSYLIPTLSLDGKLIFERPISWFGRPSLQTLEPRLYYLLTPYHDQADNPVFDTAAVDFSFASLFRDNRFTGRDRIADANQLTLGLTSRTLKEGDGAELLSASVGQILYFADRQVQIAGPAQDSQTSAVTGEISAQLLADLSARASFQYNPELDTNPWERRVVQLRYKGGDARLLNLAYRYNLGTSLDERFEDTDLTFRLPLGRRVEIVGRWLYSLLYEETMDAFAGIEFGQCCWRVRLLARNYKNSPDNSSNTSVMLQVELAGLGAFGQSIDKFLESGIYGYQRN
jgi:LPS-assembly protein